MVARAAWARTPGTLPPVPGPRRRPGRPVPIPTDPPPDSGLDVAGLEALATDAVRRAWLMTAGEGRSHLDLKPDEDLARRADAALGTPAWTRVLAGSGLPGRELLRRAMAWRYAEADGVRTLDEAPWNPDRRVMAEARQRLVDARVAGGQVRVAGNAISWRDRRVRLGHDGRWWPLAKRSGRWEPAGAPIDDIDDLIDALQDAVDGSPPQDR